MNCYCVRNSAFLVVLLLAGDLAVSAQEAIGSGEARELKSLDERLAGLQARRDGIRKLLDDRTQLETSEAREIASKQIEEIGKQVDALGQREAKLKAVLEIERLLPELESGSKNAALNKLAELRAQLRGASSAPLPALGGSRPQGPPPSPNPPNPPGKITGSEPQIVVPQPEGGPTAATPPQLGSTPAAAPTGGGASGADGTGGTTGIGAVQLNNKNTDDDCPAEKSDCRGDFEASAYLGLAIDTFASGETRLYLNPNAPNGPKERLVGGIDFAYRLMGKPLVWTGGQRYGWPNQLWVYGETVHGVRSTDIDCSKNPTFLTCQTALAIPNRPADQILFTFRNATSLEGFTGFRYEFFSLQPGSISPANLYVKAQAGFLTVSGAPSAAKAIHHVGLGAITTKGDFEGSYLEFGFGRNDLFAQKRLSRWKVDAFLSRRITRGISFFTQITVDTDIGPGSDSIQSYLGFDFDLRRFKDWFKTK